MALEVRLVDETGKQLGVMNLKEALRMARERNLDLVQVTEKVRPPVCRITDYGKYLYAEEKKKKQSKTKKVGELKGIRLSFNISPHDLEIRVRQAEKFLKRGDKIRVDIILRGRQRALQNIAEEKINQFTEVLNQKIPIKVERNIQRRGRNLTMIITKK
jgi:translation initiation factor IF-3